MNAVNIHVIEETVRIHPVTIAASAIVDGRVTRVIQTLMNAVPIHVERMETVQILKAAISVHVLWG
jgi:hypothetical protein